MGTQLQKTFSSKTLHGRTEQHNAVAPLELLAVLTSAESHFSVQALLPDFALTPSLVLAST